jgi:5-hydroxyisourate hydrolase-like protein (transthyretin family)
MARIVGIVTCLLLAVATSTAQQTAVDGIVVNLGTGETLADTQVELSKTDGQRYRTTTGADGLFLFQNLEPGEYRLTATHDGGFMPTEYGQRHPNGGGIPFTLTADRRLAGIRLALAPTGTISGRIFNRDGEPAASVSVQALRAAHSQMGQHSLSVVQAVQTNDLGEYRLFWLPPGRYYISARLGGSPPFFSPLNGSITEAFSGSPPLQMQRILENGELVEEAYVAAYFPGTTDPATASPIDLGTGSNIDGMDFILSDPVPASHVRGIVINAETGQPAAGAEVTIVPRTLSHQAIISTVVTASNGAFDISGITSGSYVVATYLGDNMQFTGYAPIEIASADLNGITITAVKGYDLPGRIIFDSGPANTTNPPPQVIPEVSRRPFVGMPPPQPFGTPPPNLADDGSFVIKSLAPGDYRVFAREFGTAVSEKFYLKSVRLGEADALINDLHIESKPEAELEIVLGTDIATLRGSAVNQKHEPVPNATVALVPYPIGASRPDLFKSAATDVSGQFEMRGIAPGDYIVLAWDQVEFGAWQDPDFVRSYESVGKRIHIGEAASETVQLTIFQ